jgi:hypothetical protein
MPKGKMKYTKGAGRLTPAGVKASSSYRDSKAKTPASGDKVNRHGFGRNPRQSASGPMRPGIAPPPMGWTGGTG